MAEVVALISATNQLLEPEFYNKRINIWSDSLSTINALSGAIATNPLIIELMDNLVLLENNTQITLNWIRGHSEQTGNEMADMLAKKGAESTPTPPPYAEFNPTSLLKHSTRLHIEDKWNKRWNSINTCEHSKSMLSTVKIRNTLPAPTKPQLCTSLK